MELNSDQLMELALDSASVDIEDMPAGLWVAISGSTQSATADRIPQHPGWTEVGGAHISALSAFITTASEFGALIDGLSEDDWHRRTRVKGRVVRDLVEHLVGMERYLLGQLGRRPAFAADRREDHWPATRAAAAELADETSTVVARQWWLEVLDLIAACGELGPDHQVRYHHLAGSARGLLVSRTFELWTHSDDIRQAVGLPFDLLDEDRLSLMVSELMSVLPIGLALTSEPLPGRTARINVTGTGGGTFDVPLGLGETPGEPDIVITVDSIGLCRVAANRLDPDDLLVEIEGDLSLLHPVLVGATAFAAD